MNGKDPFPPAGQMPTDIHDDAERDAIFARRAERLAAIPASPLTGSADHLTTDIVVVFSLGDELYAIPGEQVREVHPLSELTLLPGAPGFVAGLLNMRGRVVPVLDLRTFFGLPPSDVPPQAVLLLAGPHGDAAVLTYNRPEAQPWPANSRHSRLRELPHGLPEGLHSSYVRGVTDALVVVLDAGQLLADPRLIVQDED